MQDLYLGPEPSSLTRRVRRGDYMFEGTILSFDYDEWGNYTGYQSEDSDEDYSDEYDSEDEEGEEGEEGYYSESEEAPRPLNPYRYLRRKREARQGFPKEVTILVPRPPRDLTWVRSKKKDDGESDIKITKYYGS